MLLFFGVANSETVSLPSPRRRVWRWLPPLAILLLIEGAAWLADSRQQFRDKLLDAYDLMVVVNEPIPAKKEPPWPEGAVGVRSVGETESLRAPYLAGGRLVPGAVPSENITWLRPGGAVRASEERVFIVGGSGAFGFPYPYPDTFAALLDQSLRDRGTRVFNASRVGATSGELVPVTGRILDHYEPEVLIFFMGNNEWIHWLPEQQPGVGQKRLRLLRALTNSRALAWVAYRFLPQENQRDVGKAPRSGFERHREISGHGHALLNPLEDEQFDPRKWRVSKQRYLDAFEANLTRMIRQSKKRGVRAIVLTMPINHRLSPAWKHPQPLTFDPANKKPVNQTLRAADALQRNEEHSEALRVLDEALASSPDSPMLNYLRGECLEALTRLSEAEAAYAQCRENMIGNLGGVLSINEVIRRVATETGAGLLDVQAIFDAYGHENGSYFNQDLIHDDCHPTPLGHQLIADALLGLIDEKLYPERR